MKHCLAGMVSKGWIGVLGLMIGMVASRTAAQDNSEGWIAYMPQVMGASTIYIVQPDGEDSHRFIEGSMPAWSPTGEQMAFIRMRRGESHFFIVDANGENEREILSEKLAAHRNKIGLKWSPDGTQIAFLSFRDSRTLIVRLTLETEEVHELDVGPTSWTISWSPDSKQILFEGGKTNYDLFALDVETDEVTQLTDTETNEIAPAWSPDGSQIVFHTQVRDAEGAVAYKIYVIS
jgi:Tol biopolymer transport system component